MSKSQAAKEDLQKAPTREDLIKLVLQPLSRQTNQSWLHVLQKIEEVKDAVEIIARELARQRQANESPPVDSEAESPSTVE